ncbi:MAG: YqjF family protein [Nitrososphaerales archaeon]
MKTFLTAEWRHLLLVNYAAPAELLARHLPKGVELDLDEGRALVSLVGFRFLRTRLLGRIPVPFHTNFDELNLRFYVLRRMPDGEVRRGVVFLREYVPRFAIAATARLFYQEPYRSVRMRHTLPVDAPVKAAAYSVHVAGAWHTLSGRGQGPAILATQDRHISFIVEHYWGYTRRTREITGEYRVVHIPWLVQAVPDARFEGDPAALYGREWAPVLSQPPVSAFLAEGSPVAVMGGATTATWRSEAVSDNSPSHHSRRSH